MDGECPGVRCDGAMARLGAGAEFNGRVGAGGEIEIGAGLGRAVLVTVPPVTG